MVKNGFIHNGNQNHKCKACGRQFVEAPRQKIISEETKALIDKLLLEKIPLAGIARVCNVSETWLQDYVIDKGVPTVCGRLHGFLEGLRSWIPCTASQGCWKGVW